MQGAINLNHAMRRPAVRWLVLLFTCAWFGVLVPVHRRGAIQLPGATPACCAHKSVAADAPASACHDAGSRKSQAPTKSGSGNCAVCFFVAGLDLPAPVMLDVPPLGMAEPIARFDLPHPADREHVRTRCERGPPLA
jgi:hypothetical protein